MRIFRYLAWIGAVAAGCWTLEAQQRQDLELLGRDDDSAFDYQPDGSFSGTNGMILKYGSATLSADRVSGNQVNGSVVAEGSVLLQRGTNVWTGQRLDYNYLTENLSGEVFRTGQPPVFAYGFGLKSDPTNHVYTAEGAFITTDDYARPGYRIRARRIRIRPGEFIEAYDAVVFLGDVPVFYLPWMRRNLKERSNHFDVVPGFRSEYGPYALTRYSWYLNPQLEGAFDVDWRTKRGVGLGPEIHYDLRRWGEGSGRFYYARDHEPGTNTITGEMIPEDRYLAEFSHRLNWRTNFTGRLLYNQQSDAEVAKDFFESKYRANPQPQSHLYLNQSWRDHSLDILVHPQFNPFFETVERLPDVKFSSFRQPIPGTPFFYEGETSGAYLRRRFAKPETYDFSAFRGDTFHQVAYPNTFFNWLQFTPRMGGRFSYYSEAHGPGATTKQRARAVLNTGAETSFKAARTWTQVRYPALDIHGLRHIVRPSFNYVYIPSPTADPRELPQFDYETEQLRLPPILFPDFNMVDSIDSQNVVRLGMWNTLQTKRRQEIDDFLIWGLYTDWRINPQHGQTTFSDLYSDLEVKPREWLALASEMRYDLEHHRLRISDHRITLTPNPNWSLAVGHRFIRSEPLFGLGNNLITARIYYRLNEDWGARVDLHYEARDGVMQEQYYTLYRDLRSWTAALTFRIRRDEGEPADYGIAIALSLKSFPRFELGDDINKPNLLLGE